MRRLLFSVVLVALATIAFWRVSGYPLENEIPQRLKPGSISTVHGTAKAVPLQNTLVALLSEKERSSTPGSNKERVARGTQISGSVRVDPLLYTVAPQYDSEAWLSGGERFPAGAQVMVREGSESRALVTGFAATADANVSFDGTRVLFAGKRGAQDAWQVWEVAATGGMAKQITKCAGDCVRPLYLPGGVFVYAAKVQGRFVLQRGEFETGKTRPLYFAPGNALPTDVLRDGRILFDATYPMGRGAAPEIYTVYSDGSGVESYRCDHGPRRQAGKQATNGDIVFVADSGLGRFTSALAKQVEVKAPTGQYAGDAVQTARDEFVVAWRADAKDHWSLVRWNVVTGTFAPLFARETVESTQWAQVSAQQKGANPSASSGRALGHPADANDAELLQPAMVAPRPVPNLHPSGLHDWTYANLLCLNAYASKHAIPAGSVASAKLYTPDENGKARLLGSAPVEKDGSFYVQVPGDRPLQIELLDAKGKTVMREQGWWWMAKGEQRICVGCHAGPERSPENAVPQVLVKSVKPVAMK